MAQTVTPLPSIGDVFAGQDVDGRELRISGHPESERVVLSIWQFGRCLATVRLATHDVPDVTRALVAGLVPVPVELPGPHASVHRITRPAPVRLRELTGQWGTAVSAAATTVAVRLTGRLRHRD